MSAVGGVAKLAMAVLPHLGLAARLEDKVEAKVAEISLVIFAGLAMVVAVACGGMGLGFYWSDLYGPIQSALMVGGVFVGIAAALILARLVMTRTRENRRERDQRER